jgi:hypothetical protein
VRLCSRLRSRLIATIEFAPGRTLYSVAMSYSSPPISAFPFDPVRLVCETCGRRGQYRKQTLIERYGPDIMGDAESSTKTCDCARLNMSEQRHSSRQRTLKGASIAFNNRSSTIDCVVRNLSPGGAILKVASTVGIPDRFELKLENDNFRWCRVKWRRDDTMGIAFED